MLHALNSYASAFQQQCFTLSIAILHFFKSLAFSSPLPCSSPAQELLSSRLVCCCFTTAHPPPTPSLPPNLVKKSIKTFTFIVFSKKSSTFAV
jgi:hypothetical protein